LKVHKILRLHNNLHADLFVILLSTTFMCSCS